MSDRRVSKAGRLVFRTGYDRMAYLTTEYVTGNKTQLQLAEETGLSPQRVSQIVKAAYSRIGCKEGDAPEKIAAAMRRLFVPHPEVDTPEFFQRHEMMFRGKYNPWGNPG